MDRNAYSLCFLVLSIIGVSGCSSQPTAKDSKQAGPALDKIQGKVQVLPESTATDVALNAGGPSIYLWHGVRRYRLFVKSPTEVTPQKEYVVEGVDAQKAIDEIGDPDGGKNGYPLKDSCERVVRRAWGNGLALDVLDLHSSVLRARIKRYPARPVFLVARLREATATESTPDSAEADEDLPEITVVADKQRALLIEGPTVLPAPLWEPAGGTVTCKVIINKQGKISELESGTQLCEAVPWSQFRYQAPVQGGKPVRVKTEVAIRFDPRK